MKKTYISPEFILVELRGIQMLAESLGVDNNTTVSGTSGGWAKEDNTTISDKSLWDEEW